MIEKTCKTCTKEFVINIRSQHARKYCDDCKKPPKIKKSKTIPKTCRGCGEKFLSVSSKLHHCDVCLRNHFYVGCIIKCEDCGVAVTTTSGNQKYCTKCAKNRCYIPEKICPECNKPFKPSSNGQKYCKVCSKNGQIKPDIIKVCSSCETKYKTKWGNQKKCNDCRGKS